MKISVIVATYNRIDALNIVLQSLENQTDSNFEIVIADDGSKNDTRSFVEKFTKDSKNKIFYVWHEDLGFRLAKIRNLAIENSNGDYLVFLDGDCAVQPDFISQHRNLAEPKNMVTGSRILIEEKLTSEICSSKKWDFQKFKENSCSNFFKKQINKFLPLYIKLPNHHLRVYPKFVWRRIKGCNLACWKSDALQIGGFDESLVGWGHEDADFVYRLHEIGIKRKSGAWATEVMHLWHRMANKDNAAKNAAIVRAKIMSKTKNK
jgi:glycosyltransferase involved in cell wall biosynthesis